MSVGRALGDVLADLSVGQRLWFWFCPAHEPPLMLAPLSEPDGASRLTEAAAACSLPLGAAECSGIASVSLQGQLVLCHPLLTQAGLEALVEWVVRVAVDQPELRRLKGTCFVRMTAAGQREATLTSPAWAAVPEPLPVPGTLAYSAQVLGALQPGKDAWFWMRDDSGGGPRLAVLPLAEDPEGERLVAWVSAWRRPDARTMRGVIRLTAAGTVLLTTADALVPGVLQSTLQQLGDRFPRLAQARLVRLEAGGIAELATVGSRSPLETALRALQEGERVAFWLTEADRSGVPRLLLDVDRRALKDTAQKWAGSGRHTRGEARRTSRGWVEFRARSDLPGFLPALAAWVRTLRAVTPAVSVLDEARMTVRDRDGTILARYRDDQLWANAGHPPQPDAPQWD